MRKGACFNWGGDCDLTLVAVSPSGGRFYICEICRRKVFLPTSIPQESELDSNKLDPQQSD